MRVIFYCCDDNKRTKVSERHARATRSYVYESFNTNYLYIKEIKRKSSQKKSF